MAKDINPVIEKCDFIQYNSCKSCDVLYSFSVGSDEACSFLCPNREVNYFGSGSGAPQRNCALKKCPDTAPYQSEDGSCYETEKEAENVFEHADEDDFENEDIIDRNLEYKTPLENGKCPDNYILYNSTCRLCNDPSDWYDVKKENEKNCHLCKNRIYKFYKKWDVALCENTCPEKDQFKRWDGRCFSCDTSKAVSIETHCNIENDCNDICPNRTIIKRIGGNVPSVPNCPKEKPMMDDEGICYSCSVPIPIGIVWNKDFCHRFCPNERHLENGFCVLNTKREE